MNAYNRKKKKIDWLKIPVIKLIFRILIVLLLFSVSRWLVYLFNTEYFHHLTLGQALRLYVAGMRFDMVVIAYANAIMILYFCLPFKFIYNRVLQQIMNIYYVGVNSAIIILNMVDVVYFRFIGKQMTADLFKDFGSSAAGLWAVASQMVVDYWFILVLAILFVLVLVVVSKRTMLVSEQTSVDVRHNYIQWLSLVVFAVLTIIAARGGIQSRPVDMTTALRYADTQSLPIVVNTPFTLAKGTAGQSPVRHHYEGLEEIEFSPIQSSGNANRFISDSLGFAPNLVCVILDGIGQEVIGYYNPIQRFPLTPFLDTLLTQSLTFDGRANGRRSAEALPSLFLGIPPLTEVDINASPCFSNRVSHLGILLKRKGYATALLHSEGAVSSIDSLNQPFAVVVYPSFFPEDDILPKESYLWSNAEKAIYHTDHALNTFFKEAAAKPWYDSTLFVITAKHANTDHVLSEYSNLWGMYAIPIAFHMPSQIKPQRCDELAQQIDLNISTLSALGVNDTVISFGRNLFDSLTKPSFIAYVNQTYQYSDGQYLLQSDGNNTIGVFNIRRDRQLDDNLVDRIKCEDIAMIMKKIIQEYEQAKDTLYPQSCSGKVGQK